MSHLTTEQRYTIAQLKAKGFSQKLIAEVIEKDKSVVCRELNRNCDQRNKEYRPELAQDKYEKRKASKPKQIKFTDEIREKVISMLEMDYSPEQVVGTLKKNNEDTVSHETIYKFVWKDKRNKGELHTHLRRKGRHYRKRGSSKDSRGKLVGRVGIEKRPLNVLEKTAFGNIELDTIIGKNQQGAIITMNDISSGMLWMRKVESRDAHVIRSTLCKMLDEIKPYLKTITSDNGKEFAEHQYIADEYCDYYFANPYSPWERGANENLNGLIRQYIPKKTDFSTVSEEYIKEIEKKINERPRKRFGYENPIFVMNKLLNHEVAFVG
jgi:transposase, IS30 family